MSLNRRYKLLLLGGGTILGALCSGMSVAQPISPDDILVFQRHEVDYNSPVGIPLGGFLLTTGLSYNAIYDDNIFLKKTNLTHDFINVFKPGIALQSNWGRHEVFVGLEATKTDYRWNSQKDALDYGGIVSGTYDISYGTFVNGYLKKNQRNLSRGSEDDVDGSVPIKYNSWASRIGFTRALSYIQMKAAAFHDNTQRADSMATAVAGDFLERDSNGLEGTLTYEYFPKNNLFVTVAHTNIDYNLVGGDSRIVNKSELKYGMNFSYWDMYSGSLYFGHLRTDYSHIDNGSNDPYATFILNWAPEKLTNVSFSTGRSYSDGNISADEKVIIDNMKLAVSHQFMDSVTGNIYGTIADNSYKSLAGAKLRDNRVYGTGVDAQYKVSDHMGLKLGYDYKHRNSDIDSENYKDNRILFSVTYMH